MAYSCKILADSMNPVGDRVTTFEICFPRIVLAEFNTHRVFSRNSASSRAIPVKKQLERVKKDPFIPVYWGRNQAGMQAAQELTGWRKWLACFLWLRARDIVVLIVRMLVFIDLHKQIANRLLEPWMWHTVIVTATEYENFFGLRDNKQAQPEIKVIAGMMQPMYRSSVPVQLKAGEWHLPLVRHVDQDDLMIFAKGIEQNFPGVIGTFWEVMVKISSGRCARVSYLTHDGKRDAEADVALAGKLHSDGHMSPMEHPCQALDTHEQHGNLTGFKQYRKMLPGEAIFKKAA